MKKFALTALFIVIVVFIGIGIKNLMTKDAKPTTAAYNGTTTTLYATDGKQITVDNSEVAANLEKGWHQSYNEVTTTLFSADGRQTVVYNDEIPDYLKDGWHQSYDEVTTTLYSGEDKEIVVFKNDVPAYLAAGWSIGKGLDPNAPMVAITFDDGPSPYYTKRIVDTLVKYDCTATFFVAGSPFANNYSISQYAYDNGMEIGNHTYNHKQLSKCSATTITDEIEKNASQIRDKLGVTPALVRPPYGAVNDTVKATVAYPMINWSIDTLDWKSRNAQSVYKEVAGKVRDGDIILMHDLYESTADAVDLVIPYLREAGFQVVSVSTLAQCKGDAMSAGKVYNSFK